LVREISSGDRDLLFRALLRAVELKRFSRQVLTSVAGTRDRKQRSRLADIGEVSVWVEDTILAVQVRLYREAW
jgi:hypothetical protein